MSDFLDTDILKGGEVIEVDGNYLTIRLASGMTVSVFADYDCSLLVEPCEWSKPETEAESTERVAVSADTAAALRAHAQFVDTMRNNTGRSIAELRELIVPGGQVE